MGMPITVEVVDPSVSLDEIQKIFDYFDWVDRKFSPFKPESELSLINQDKIKESDWSEEMKLIFGLAEETKRETGGYFDILTPAGYYDPSGLVKGWAIRQAAEILSKDGYLNFYIEAGGDIEARGKNDRGKNWSVGVRDPFNPNQIVKRIRLTNRAIATSGTYFRGQHIYNPLLKRQAITDVVSLTVIGPNIYEADRFATAAFAMGRPGVDFIQGLNGFEGYLIKTDGRAVMTSGFEESVF